MSSPDLNRLARVCGMLGSEHMGERAAAALKADQVARALGGWDKVLASNLSHAPGQLPGAGKFCGPQPTYPDDDLHRTARTLLSQSELTEWEREFCTSLLLQRRHTPKQITALYRVFDRVHQRKARAA